MKHVVSLLLALAAASTVLSFPADIQKELDSLPPKDHVTITFYKNADCADSLNLLADPRDVVLTCPNDFSNAVDQYSIDPQAVNSTCVSGKFASYKISDQFDSMEKLASIGVRKGQSKCMFKDSNKEVKTFKPSVPDFVSGGCHNLGADDNPLKVQHDTTYTFQCTRGWAKTTPLEKRFKHHAKGEKGPFWVADGAVCGVGTGVKCTGDMPKIDIPGKRETSDEGEVLEKRFKHHAPGEKGPFWVADGSACGPGTGVKCKGETPKLKNFP